MYYSHVVQRAAKRVVGLYIAGALGKLNGLRKVCVCVLRGLVGGQSHRHLRRSLQGLQSARLCKCECPLSMLARLFNVTHEYVSARKVQVSLDDVDFVPLGIESVQSRFEMRNSGRELPVALQGVSDLVLKPCHILDSVAWLMILQGSGVRLNCFVGSIEILKWFRPSPC